MADKHYWSTLEGDEIVGDSRREQQCPQKEENLMYVGEAAISRSLQYYGNIVYIADL